MILTKPLNFLREVRSEMERVSWPSRDQTVRLSTIVIVLTAGVAVYIGLLDSLFTKLAAILFNH